MNAPVPVHAESVRVGVRMACLAIHGTLPDPPTIAHIMDKSKSQVELHEFPMEVISAAAMARKERRRLFAVKAMEAFLHHCGDQDLLTSDHLDRLVTRSWHVAAAMEREDDVATQLDSIKPAPVKDKK